MHFFWRDLSWWLDGTHHEFDIIIFRKQSIVSKFIQILFLRIIDLSACLLPNICLRHKSIESYFDSIHRSKLTCSLFWACWVTNFHNLTISITTKAVVSVGIVFLHVVGVFRILLLVHANQALKFSESKLAQRLFIHKRTLLFSISNSKP